MKLIFQFTITISALAFTSLAQAYIGPGAGVSAIGSVVAIVFAILLILIGFLWYPIKRIIKRKHDKKNQSLGEEQPLDDEDNN